VLPTYNESSNLLSAVERIVTSLQAVGCSFEVIVVDDDSPDGTWKLADEIACRDSRIRVVRRKGERGLASAVAAGWQVARGGVLGVMDADLQYAPETLPTLLAALTDSGADIAICSRYAPGGTIENWSLFRWVISWSARLIGRLFLPTVLQNIADPGSGYFLVRREVLQGVTLRPRGFKILIEVLARGRHRRVIELGLPYAGRRGGESKFRSRQALEYLTQLTKLSRETRDATRQIRRAAVGLSALVMGLLLLWALSAHVGLPYFVAAVVSVESIIVCAFAADELVGFRRKGSAHRLVRFRRKHFRNMPAAAVGVVVFIALTEGGDVPYLASAVAALPAAAIVKRVVIAGRESPVTPSA
jgi:dolichol-phosphate mannosyltransferase